MSKYEQAFEKVQGELSVYKENLLLQTPEKIYMNSLESVIKEEAAEIFSQIIHDFSDEQLDTVINTESFLDEVLETFFSDSVDLNDMRLILFDTVDELISYQNYGKDVYNYNKETEKY